MEFLTAPPNVPFTIALAIVFLLGALEGVSLLLGGASSLSDAGADHLAVDHIGAPDTHLGAPVDIGHADISHVSAGTDAHIHADTAHGPDVDGHDLGSQILTWLHVGQIPSMILLIVFLLAFGAGGLVIQAVLKSAVGVLLPAGWAVAAAFTLALPGTRIMGGLLKPLLPRDETEAVSRESFVGCEAQIMAGTARQGAPAEARLRDRFGRSHYILVEPDKDDAVFRSGSTILILKRQDAIYRGVEVAPAQLDD
ncbi:MAG TPA: YqiJ family protein [Abditibacteriaceae bacterium]|nr:YqiJ family protein [Abditibacteriaceae bacterium]